MEESFSPHSMISEDQHVAFGNCSNAVGASADTRERAWELMRQVSEGHSSTKEDWQFMVAASLFASRQQRSEYTLQAVLEACRIPLLGFLESLKRFLQQAKLGAEADHTRKRLQQKCVVGQVLYSSYSSQLFPHFIGPPTSDQRKRFFSVGWTLFLLSKAELLEEDSTLDLRSGYDLLLCVCHYLRSVSPTTALSNNVLAPTLGGDADGSSDIGIDHLPIREPFQRLVRQWAADGVLSPWGSPGDRKTFGRSEILERALLQLRQRYDAWLQLSGDFSEQYDQPATHAASLGDPIRSPLPRDKEGGGRKLASLTSTSSMASSSEPLVGTALAPPLSPYRGGSGEDAADSASTPTSPVALRPSGGGGPMLKLTQWLRTQFSSLRGSTVSFQLQDAFLKCEEDPEPAIRARLDEMAKQVAQQGLGGGSDAAKLYYYFLEETIRAEDGRGKGSVEALLSSDWFHRALYASALLVVSGAYKRIHVGVDDIARAVGVGGYAWLKGLEGTLLVLQSRPVPSSVSELLSRAIWQLCQTTIWQDGSPVFEFLRNETEREQVLLFLDSHAAASSQSSQSLGAGGGSGSSPIVPSTSTSSSSMPTSSSVRSPVRIVGAMLTSTRLPVAKQALWRYVWNMASSRTAALLLELLRLPSDLVRPTMRVLRSLLVHHAELLRNRLLDTLLLCAVLAVALYMGKPGGEALSFRQLLSAYRRLNDSSPAAYRAIAMPDAASPRDIVWFYNHEFVALAKPLVMAECSNPQLLRKSALASSSLAPSRLGQSAISLTSNGSSSSNEDSHSSTGKGLPRPKPEGPPSSAGRATLRVQESYQIPTSPFVQVGTIKLAPVLPSTAPASPAGTVRIGASPLATAKDLRAAQNRSSAAYYGLLTPAVARAIAAPASANSPSKSSSLRSEDAQDSVGSQGRRVLDLSRADESLDNLLTAPGPSTKRPRLHSSHSQSS